MSTIQVRLKTAPYSIVIGKGSLKTCGRLLKRLDLGKDAVVITNARLLKLYKNSAQNTLEKNAFTTRFALVPDSEKAKSADIAIGLLNLISAYDKYRQIFIIALGGGVVGDLAGFVASVYKRGIPYVQIPTTLLAQVDSSIGGKTAIDLPSAKNLVGTFYQPSIVISDISLIKTLPDREVKSGIAEIIKYGVIKDMRLFEFLESNFDKVLARDESALTHIIARSAAIKAAFVEKDEFDKNGIRAILNFGHTIGHAIEAACGYSADYTHGEAIAIGMVSASRISVELGILKKPEADRIERLVNRCGLPTKIKALRLSDILEAYLHDKKFIGQKNRLILPLAIGSARVVENVPPAVIKNIIKQHIV